MDHAITIGMVVDGIVIIGISVIVLGVCLAILSVFAKGFTR